MTIRPLLRIVLTSLVLTSGLRAQGPPAALPAEKPALPGQAAPPQPTPPPPPPREAYAYLPDGRRDPFISLIGTGASTGIGIRKAEGPAGMTIAEISVRGILQSRGALVAMISGADTKTYIVHQGDRLLDGSIKTITPRGLICVQDVNDPLSLVKQREVSKLLRGIEDPKE
jgi:hypothetical protein